MEQGKKNKRLFWVPAVAPLTSVVLSTLLVYITHAEKEGVAIVSIFVHIVLPPSQALSTARVDLFTSLFSCLYFSDL